MALLTDSEQKTLVWSS